MSGADRRWLLAAIELSRSCPVATTAYAVGAIVVGADGGELSRGYSREADPADHAEESALGKPALTGVDLRRATIYTSLEPCSTRRSRARSCTELILTAGIRRVVFAMREPPTFADCRGAETLQEAGVEVVELAELAGLVQRVNAHVFGSGR
ncbi:MAG: dCMP deaminase [Actinobacteria bacterium]|nr:MAG: dCMP deaminase [Actinomycetota bacterium]